MYKDHALAFREKRWTDVLAFANRTRDYTSIEALRTAIRREHSVLTVSRAEDASCESVTLTASSFLQTKLSLGPLLQIFFPVSSPPAPSSPLLHVTPDRPLPANLMNRPVLMPDQCQCCRVRECAGSCAQPVLFCREADRE